MNRKIGVVLFQLGGPDSLESVEPFLFNLFTDPDIIDLPFAFLFRKPLARLISRRRGPYVRKHYEEIGGRSPILRMTRRQAAALEVRLRREIDAKVFVAMRYWSPFTSEVIRQVTDEGIEQVVLLPLYPQYSVATTGSSLHEWERVVQTNGLSALRYDLVEEYSTHPSFIRSLVENIGIALRRVPSVDRKKVHLLFSAHGTPVKLVKRGDPYQRHVIQTYESVVKEGQFGLAHSLCYQSKVGPEKWLEPSLDESIERLAREGTTHVIVVPLAFVSDHIETLHEINIEAKEEAKILGIRHYDMMPALNTNRHFIEALADLVVTKVRG
ncbi:MAG: ferrochelatase [Ignavibacteria bacterium]|nr:ferrochelatase [Ignavibacteria bacterium]